MVVNYCQAHSRFYGGYTTHGWTATVFSEQSGLGVLQVNPDRPVDPADWHLSVNGQLFAPVNARLRFEGLPLPADAAAPRMTYTRDPAMKKPPVPAGFRSDEYRWEDWPSTIRWSAHAREHTFLVYRGVALALPSVLDSVR